MGRGPGPGNEGRTSRKGRRRGTTTAAVQPASACPHNTVVLTTQAQKKTNSMTTTRLTTLHSRVALHSRDYRVQTAHYTPLARAIYRVVAACTGLDKNKYEGGRRALGGGLVAPRMLVGVGLLVQHGTARHGTARLSTETDVDWHDKRMRASARALTLVCCDPHGRHCLCNTATTRRRDAATTNATT